MVIFDAHCHLNHEDLYKDIDEVIRRAKNNHVEYFLVVGYDKNTSLLAVKIAEKYDFVYAAIGYHPTEINVSEEDFQEVMNLLNHPKVIALGEIGLDYYWVKDEEERNKQKEYFIRQIEIANKYNKPISIHCRDAINDTLEIVKEHRPIAGGIMHCYSGSLESAYEFIKCGLYISLGGPVTFKNAKEPKRVAENVPLESLLVETDSPYLAPHPFRGTQNEPANTLLVVNEIALLRNMSPEDVAKATLENARRLFKL